MNHYTAITAALKGKSPIVALPIEGAAPVCIERKRLAAWCKGVTITNIEVIMHYLYSEPQIPYEVQKEYVRGAKPEGPSNRLPGHRTLVIEGRAGRVKTSCRMMTIDRRTAAKKLGEWSEKERARLTKKILLGALSKDQKKVLKLAKFDDAEGAGMVPVMVSGPSNIRRQALGVPVAIAEMPEAEFILHRSVYITNSEAWNVTERYTGKMIGSGPNPEAALLAARIRTSHLTAEQIASARATIAEAQSTTAVAA